MERKDSDLFKTRDRLNKLEADYAQLRESYKKLKSESEEKIFALETQKKTDNNSKGGLEQQISKLRDLLTQER